jgi:predicted 3-demethylubiquinone-9 3-methyltransferase (glyoxalase superfamily)
MVDITTCLWFNDQAEEAAQFYTKVLRNGSIVATTKYGDAASNASNMPKGSTLTVTFEAEGQKFLALNGGPEFTFTEAVSFMVYRDTQEEIDEIWDALTDGGEESVCGWLKDKYGVSWQVVPTIVARTMEQGSQEEQDRLMEAVITMKKLEVDTLERAVAGKPWQKTTH